MTGSGKSRSVVLIRRPSIVVHATVTMSASEKERAQDARRQRSLGWRGASEVASARDLVRVFCFGRRERRADVAFRN